MALFNKPGFKPRSRSTRPGSPVQPTSPKPVKRGNPLKGAVSFSEVLGQKFGKMLEQKRNAQINNQIAGVANGTIPAGIKSTGLAKQIQNRRSQKRNPVQTTKPYKRRTL